MYGKKKSGMKKMSMGGSMKKGKSGMKKMSMMGSKRKKKM